MRNFNSFVFRCTGVKALHVCYIIGPFLNDYYISLAPTCFVSSHAARLSRVYVTLEGSKPLLEMRTVRASLDPLSLVAIICQFVRMGLLEYLVSLA